MARLPDTDCGRSGAGEDGELPMGASRTSRAGAAVSPASGWPEVTRFTDHWSWRPEWTAQRPRLLWYLTFETVPDLHRLAEAAAARLRAAAADVIPPRWLHLTVSDVGFADQVHPSARAAAAAAVRGLSGDEAPLDVALGPVDVLPGAVVLPARPPEPLARTRDLVRRASAQAGIDPADDLDDLDDLDGEYRPHVSLCYVNRGTDHDALQAAVRSAGDATVTARRDRLTQALVTRRDGHYRWEVLDEVRLGEQPPERTPGQGWGRAR